MTDGDECSGRASIPTPTLLGDGLLLRGFEPDDVAAVATAYQDPAMRQWHRKDLRDPAAAASWVAEQRAGSHRSASWAVVEPGFGCLVGQVALRAVNLPLQHAMVGYWVVPEARGRGITALALPPLVELAFGALGLHRLELLHSTGNPASCAVAAAAGFRHEGTKRRAVLHADGWHDMHLHARLTDDPAPTPRPARTHRSPRGAHHEGPALHGVQQHP